MLTRVTRLLFVAWFALLAILLSRGMTHGWSIAVWTGLYLLILGHPTLLAVEFFLSRRVVRAQAAPRVLLGTLVRAWFGEWVISTVVFGWRLPWRADAFPDHLPGTARGSRGIVFVHGFICNRGVWNPWLARLRQLDRAFVAVSLEPVYGSIDDGVSAIEDAVRRVESATGLAPVVVAHSMGGLSVRAWLRSRRTPACGDGREEVAHLITLGTPHHGTWLANLSTTPSGLQMRPGGPWLAALAGGEPSDFGRLFDCWWTDCDQIVFPRPTAVIVGSRSHRLSGVGHVGLIDRPEIFEELLQRLDR